MSNGLKDGLNLDHQQIQGITITLDERNYWKEVLLDRYHTDILISGYEVKYRAAIVKRWHELEANTPPNLEQPKPKPATIRPTKEFKDYYSVAKLIGLDKNAAAISANQAVNTLTGTNVLKLLGVTHLEAENQESLAYTPSELGMRLGLSGRAFNILLEQVGLQTKVGDRWVPTDKAAGLFRLFDTGKKHGSGVPVQQMKWHDQVLAMVGQAM